MITPGHPTVDPTTLAAGLEQLPMGVSLWRLEVPGDSRSFRILYTNASMSALLGADVRSFVGELLFDAIPGVYSNGRAEIYMEALQKQKKVLLEPIEYEDATIKRDRYSAWAVPLSTDTLMVVLQDPAPYLQELAASEGRFRALIENSGDAVHVSDANGVIRFVSASVTRILGYLPDEMIGRQGAAFVHPDDAAGADEALRQLIAEPGTSVQLEQRVERKDGTWIHMEVVATNRLNDPAVNGLVVNYRDISKRKRAEEEQRKSEERFRSVIEQFPYAVVTYAPDGTAQSANRAWEVMWNDRRENTLGYNIRKDPQVVASGQIVHVEKAFNGELALAEPYLYDPGLSGHAGRKRWIQSVLFPLKSDQNELLQVVLVLQDVTDSKEAEAELRRSAERKKQEEVLKQSEERTRAILDNAYDAFVGMDEQGAITEWNTTAEKIFGWSRTEAIGRSLSDTIIPAQHVEGHRRGMAHYLRTGEGPILNKRLELTAMHRNGTEFPVEISIRALKVDGKHIFNAFIADITERKTNEREVRRMDERFRRLLESAPDAMVIIDGNGIIQLVNVQAERIFGFSREEMLAQPVEMIIPDNILGNNDQQVAHLTRDPDARMMGHGIELEGRRKDGSVLPIEVTLSLLEVESGLLVSAAIRDITERKKTQDAQRHLVAIMASSNDAIIGKDTNGIITSWNPGAERLFGYAAAEVIGKSITLLFPSDKVEEEKMIAQSVFWEGGRVQHYETVRKRKNGTLVDVSLTISPVFDEQGVIIGASKFAHDITHRKKAEVEIRELNSSLERRVAERTEQVRQTEKRYYHALDSMIEGVSIVGFDWRFVYVNLTTAARTEYQRDELIGRSLMELYPGIENHPLFPVLERCMKDRVSESVETEFKFPNGKSVHYAMSIQPAIDGIFMLSTDISERKRTEQELATHREQLKRQNTELEQFAFIASHDLQEPLRMVTSYVQLLERRYGEKLDNDAREFIGYAVDGTVRMKQLISDLLAYSRLGRTIALEPVDMNTVMKRVVANLSPAIAECDAVVTFDDLPTLRASHTEMLQVMQNLISNAMKFRRDDATPEIHVSASATAEQIRFAVRDNGIGIDEQYRERVFLPFKRLHDRAKYAGSGIGLAVAQKIIHRYGGTIGFTSVPGKGTTFHFTMNRTTP